MKIFIGTAEIAGMMTFVSNALKECGHEVTTCIDNFGNVFYDYQYDIILNRKIFANASSNKFIRKAQTVFTNSVESSIRRKVYYQHRDLHDVYIFIWNGFLPDRIDDYAYLKQHGKKIITLFLGSDVRHVSAFVQEYNLDVSLWEKWFHSADLNDKLFRLRKAELFSDLVFSVPDQAGLAIRPYHKVYIPFNTNSFVFRTPDRAIPKIVHIPSRTGIKGTPFILKTLEELKNEGLEFEFEFITGVPNDVVLEKLRDADILVDEIYLHGPGTLSLEAMASGCAVATKTFENEIYDEFICNVNFNNLKPKLRNLISDIEYRKALAHKGRKAIEWINDPKRIVMDMLEKLKTNNDEEVKDFYRPQFFSERYVLPHNSSISRLNKKLTRRILEKFSLSETLNIDRMVKEKLL